MLTMNQPLPPKLASSDTIEAMHALLTVIGNPAAAQANLDALMAARRRLTMRLLLTLPQRRRRRTPLPRSR